MPSPRPHPSARHPLAPVWLLVALFALAGCEDDVKGGVGTGSEFGNDEPRPEDRGPGDDDDAAEGADAEPDRGAGGTGGTGGGSGGSGGEGGTLYEDWGPDATPPLVDAGPDEGTACADGQVRTCEGGCPGSRQTCVRGLYGDCEPPAEVCNGRDDDCDGTTDEGFPVGEACVEGRGACAAEGVKVCDGDYAVRCDAEPLGAEAEGCNGIDDDCDGTVDEDFGGGGPCRFGLGVCAAAGIEICRENSLICFGEAGEPRDERCDGFDDDCDGTVDEDFDLAAPCVDGEGVCRAEGTVACGPDGAAVCVTDGASAAAELCNGLDDDCDGATDEQVGGGEPCAVGVGACRRPGGTVCRADGTLGCGAEPGPPSDEVCNGRDDDCDGVADEGLGLGEPCAVGEGACRRAAVWVCAPGGGLRCPAEPGAPVAERCSGADDDCDGATDEGFDPGAACTVGIGACARDGLLACAADGGAVCGVEPGAPVAERCDGADDDCDGAIDEGFDLGEPCRAGLGECARDGVRVCAPDGEATCGAREGEPAFEACDGDDDDCDGAIDEGFGLGAACTVGRGACVRPGVFVCGPGGDAAVCDAEPGPPGIEVCNGIDDDCDGIVDDGFDVGAPCSEGEGQCRRAGRVACVAGGAACDAVPGPRADELCNGLDDDCDGRADEGYGIGGACTEGIGACAVDGNVICVAGRAGCSVEEGPPDAERCNDIDDDCDGVIDEGFRLGERCVAGVGQCLVAGRLVCGDAGEAVCDAVPPPGGVEACNGLDDDCDGTSDEDLGLGERCAVGVGACRQLGVNTCGGDGQTVCTAIAGAPSPERCNAIDDDCDGRVDEDFDLDVPCAVGLGACRVEGRTVCAADGRAARCGAVAGEPSPERCDGVDDDCDGRADEGLRLGEDCAVGLGTCRAEGEVVCADDGEAVCSAAPGPARRERCDALDDDCDGRVDEGYDVGGRCVSGLGVCAVEGRTVCVDGDGACDAEPEEPDAELCDDLDNDCDGVVDEGEGPLAGEPFGLCGPRYRSCLDALRQGRIQSGVYRISPEGGAGAEVWCDQETDGGGWTLVLASAEPPTDGIGAWHPELRDTTPRRGHAGVWAGLSHLGDRPFDVRFACRAAAGQIDAPYTVDVSFYGTPWYRGFIRGGDAVSCFAAGDGPAELPARRDNRSGGVRAAGQPYPLAAGGRLVGEAACDAPDDFVVDFDDGGLAGAGLDGTAWGALDGDGLCGQAVGEGQWLVFAREAVDHPLGPIGLLGVPDLAAPLEAAGFEPVELDYEPALRGALDAEVLPAVFVGRYAHDWALLQGGVRAALECYSAEGGSVVTEYDGFSAFGSRYAAGFAWLVGAPDPPWTWVRGEIGGGGARAVDTPVSLVERGDPVSRGLGEQLLGGVGTERFVTLTQVHPTVPTGLRTLARFPGDQAAFPAASYPALLRGRRCEGNLLVGLFDYADAPGHPGVARLIGNLAAAAVSPPDPTLPDLCGPIFGGGQACQ